MRKLINAVLAAGMIFALTACGSKLNGTYEGEMGSYTFKSNNTVVVDTLGAKMEMKYELDGKDVRIMVPQGAVMIMTLVDDNTISGPMGMKMVKK